MNFNQKRIVLTIFLSIALTSLGNAIFEWGVAPGYEKDLVIVSFVLLAGAIKYIGPSFAEILAYRMNKKKAGRID